MEKRIFISHSNKDKQAAQNICNALEQRGLKCWIAPRDIPYGSHWAGEISRAISKSSAFLFLSSCNSNASDQVSREIQLAIQSKLTVIPILLDDSEYNDSNKYYLATIHCMLQYDGEKLDTLATDIFTMLYPDRELPECITAPQTPSEEKKPRKKLKIKKKPLIAAVLIILLMAAGTLLGVRLYEKAQWEKELDDKYEFILSAPEEMSARDFEAAVSTVKQRMELLMGEEPYLCRSEGTSIRILVERDFVGEQSPEIFIKGYISRAMRLSITANEYYSDPPEGYKDLIEVTPEDIENISISHGTVENAPEQSHTDENGGYDYMEITFSQEFMKENREAIGLYGDGMILALDKQEVQNYIYFIPIASPKENSYYIIPDAPFGTACSTLKHNFTSEPMSSSLNVEISAAPVWDDISSVKGENQVAPELLGEDTVTFRYSLTYGELTEGKYLDVRAAFRARLDALGVSYALGDDASMADSVIVRMNKSEADHTMMKLLADNSFSVEGSLSYSIVSTYYGSQQYLIDEGDSLKIAPSYESDKFSFLGGLAEEKGDGYVYLVSGTDNLPVACCKASDVTDEGISFTLLCDESRTPIKQGSPRLPAFIEALYINPLPSGASYRLYDCSFSDGGKEDELTVPLKAAAVMERIRGLYPEAELIYSQENELRIFFEETVDDGLPERVIEKTKKIFEAADYESSGLYSINIYFLDEIDSERCRVFLWKNRNSVYDTAEHEDGYIYMTAVYCEGRLEATKDKFNTLINSDETLREYIHTESGVLNTVL